MFFTRNGKKLEDVVHGLKSQNFFPALGANGPCVIHVNFGQAGFVFIEANVKKWGLAPMTGSLAPPPPYGVETDTVLLATGTKDGFTSTPSRGHQYSHSAQLYRQGPNASDPGHGRSRSGNFRMLSPTSPGPLRSPTDISLAHLIPTDEGGEPSSSAATLVHTGGPDHHHHHHPTTVGLGLHDHDNRPPPEYTSPEHSDAEESDGDGGDGSTRNSSDSENAPLIRLTRSRGTSSATARGSSNHNRSTPPQQQPRGPPSPPIPTYQDAIRQGAGRDRSGSTRSARGQRS
jgi:hypothetical protein